MRFVCARAKRGAPAALHTSICALGAVLAVALAGCSATTNVKNGTPVLTLRSFAAGDFSSYVVGISSIVLTRSDGYTAYVNGLDEQVDLTKRTDLSELFSAPGVPTGSYTSVSIAFDYGSSVIPVIYLKGQSTAATVKDSSGTTNPGYITFTVKFDPANPLVIGLNKSTPLAIDVDLAASNSIDTSTNTVTVKPFVVATAQPLDTVPLRARGLFIVAKPSAGTYVENIRPFDDTYYTDSPVGALTVNTTSSTYFNINGNTYQGSAGLSAMTSLNTSAEVTAYGTLSDLSTITPTLDATQVYAGTSVISAGTQVVRGIVSARSGNTLTVQGAEFVCQEGLCPSMASFTYYPTATVTVGSSTVVTEDGAVDSGLSAQSISVGQRISASGVGTLDSSGALSMNSNPGIVRLQPTAIWGTLNSGAAGSATLTLQQIDAWAPSSFTFTGTGITSGNDASASSYVVNTGSVDESATPAATLLRADGFMTPFGSAPPDFTASTITPATSEPTSLIVEWSGGTTSPFTTYGSSGLVVNLGNSSISTAILRTGPQTIQLSSLSASPTIMPSCASGTCPANSEFAIGNAANGIDVFNSSSAFLSDLSSTLNGSNAVFKLVAVGSYDSASNTFYTQRMDVALE